MARVQGGLMSNPLPIPFYGRLLVREVRDPISEIIFVVGEEQRQAGTLIVAEVLNKASDGPEGYACDTSPKIGDHVYFTQPLVWFKHGGEEEPTHAYLDFRQVHGYVLADQLDAAVELDDPDLDVEPGEECPDCSGAGERYEFDGEGHQTGCLVCVPCKGTGRIV